MRLFLLFFIAFMSSAHASGLPLPRFVSLRTNPINLRTGPGVRYPIEWVYMKSDLPILITEEFENWRKIKDWEGKEGWVHQHMVSGRRTVRVTKETFLLRAPSKESLPIAKIQSGVVGKLNLCPVRMDLCKIEFKNFQGWVDKKVLWGVAKNETYTP